MHDFYEYFEVIKAYFISFSYHKNIVCDINTKMDYATNIQVNLLLHSIVLSAINIRNVNLKKINMSADLRNVNLKKINMSADLRKGSFGHFSSFCVIKISRTCKFSKFCMFLQLTQIASNM